MGFLSRNPALVVASVLIAWAIAAWFSTDYIENVVRPRQQQERLVLIGDQIAGAAGLFKRGKYEEALQEYQFVLSAFADSLPDETAGALHDATGRSHAAIARKKDGKLNYGRAIEAFDRALAYRVQEKGLADHVSTVLRRGQAVQALALLRSDAEGLFETISSYEATLAMVETQDLPGLQSAVYRFLGNSHRALYRMNPERRDMRAALERYETALSLAMPVDYPDAHAAALTEKGRAYVILAERKYRRRYLETAVKHFEIALGRYAVERVPKQHAETQLLLGDTYFLLAGTKAKSRYDRAAHRLRVIRYKDKAKQAHRIAQAFGLRPSSGISVEDPVAIVDVKKPH